MTETDKSHLLEVRHSVIHGHGIFAVEDIAPEELLFIIRGEVIDEDECGRREEEEGNVYIFYNGDSYIDTAKTDVIKYLNHCCKPNCKVIDRDEESLKLVSAMPIKKGDEITIDYGYEEIYEECKCAVCMEKNKE